MIGDEIVFDREDVNVHDRGVLHPTPQFFAKGLQSPIEFSSGIIVRSEASELIDVACIMGGGDQYVRQTAQWPGVVHPEILPSALVYAPYGESNFFHEDRDVPDDLRIRKGSELNHKVVLADVNGVESVGKAVLANQICVA